MHVFWKALHLLSIQFIKRFTHLMIAICCRITTNTLMIAICCRITTNTTRSNLNDSQINHKVTQLTSAKSAAVGTWTCGRNVPSSS